MNKTTFSKEIKLTLELVATKYNGLQATIRENPIVGIDYEKVIPISNERVDIIYYTGTKGIEKLEKLL